MCGAQPVIIDEGVVDLSSDESLQATDNVFLRQPLGGAGDVINGRLVPAHADDHDSIERRIGLPVASAEQPVPVRDSALRLVSDRRRRVSQTRRRTGSVKGCRPRRSSSRRLRLDRSRTPHAASARRS